MCHHPIKKFLHKVLQRISMNKFIKHYLTNFLPYLYKILFICYTYLQELIFVKIYGTITLWIEQHHKCKIKLKILIFLLYLAI